ncbi:MULTISPECIES: bifunctional adenosylcobinamide kinase/adenosylcobinamide-phosphate guanylyltransferase [unclassified Cytobacillus]|uniref:bifunctional adenosylcobinamide kinase/adenosylcobinamide-phosphate guanylyltransferase n=1 Tax=unclassified Cytobacillus TaxID=2675268 RepID=UPI00135B5063|nr:bifunctional adenosylcobinamide kinase/adenosylcobinamide-phosphate guanylyltransferase [Cytobacillus sp. AMY 15.2]MCM3092883.1 bifunctional adenosylcobinamide kinase/adenosylcobinamide-phosphate guanylyltransferase [Cytobacillus sp. AMY 15.2]
MHFITGGRFNGKSEWVKEFYQLEDTPHKWISAYHGEFPDDLDYQLIVFEGIEQMIREWSSTLEFEEIRGKWQAQLEKWLKWEKAAVNRKMVLIGSDMSKGIVPMEAADRKWRDASGWAFQDAAAAADRVDLIWYGISQKIK